MENIIAVVRYIHIICAVFWGGTLITMNFFLFPAIKAMGPDGGKFMQQFSKTNSFPQVMTIAGTLTVITGIVVFWKYSAGFNPVFLASKMSILFIIGGVFGLAAYLQGIFVNRPGILLITKINSRIASSGAPPEPEQIKELGRLRDRIFNSTKWITLYVIISVTLMSLARYI